MGKHHSFCALRKEDGFLFGEGINKFVDLNYDEMYGISGRLLLFCQTEENEYNIQQIFNYDEVIPLSHELNKFESSSFDELMSNKKPFSIIIKVYQMLYGDECVDNIIYNRYRNTYCIH